VAETPRARGTLVAAVLLAPFAFLPVPQWLMGLAAGNAWRNTAAEWIAGTAITLGIALALAILARGAPALWRDGLATRAGNALDRHAPWLALAAAIAYALIARLVFSGRPLTIDEILQHYQALIFAGGRLALPTAPHPEFFTAVHVVDHAGRTFTHFPPGWPAMLAAGVLAGVPWLVAPACGAVAVLAWRWYLRATEEPAPVRSGALLLLAFAPFTLFMSGSELNHAPTLMWLMIAAAALVQGMRAPRPRPALALVAGLAFGAAATIRPVDALAFALPAAAWYLARALREPARWRDALAAAAGVALPMALLLWFNARTTGHPLTFGYELLWGKSHGLGFHLDPYGRMHTPARGVAQVSAYLLRLQSYLFEWPVPSLLAPLAALALSTRRLRAADRYLLARAALLLLLYVAYWFDGLTLGPRFVYLLVPVAALWTARLPGAVRARFGTGLPLRVTMYAFVVAIAIGLAFNVPLRWRQYASSLNTERWDADAAARAAGVQGALVFVRGSWGSQVIARLWGLGVSRSDAEGIYRRVDTCVLDRAVAALERAGVRGDAAWARLAPLKRDSARVVRSTLSPDGTERVLPGIAYPPACVAQVLADRQGYTHHMPLLLATGNDNLYARDLGARDTLLLAAHPGRPVYLLTGTPAPPGSWRAPRFIPLRADSILAAARAADDAPLVAPYGVPSAAPRLPRATSSR
jgi:hypothetical protein